MKNILELVKLVQGTARNESEQLNILASMGKPPEENFEPKMRLPVQNDIPAFSLKSSDFGSAIADLEHGRPAPVFGQGEKAEPSLGQLLTGDL